MLKNPLDAYLDNEDEFRWEPPECGEEFPISDHVKERIKSDLDSGIYHVYLHARTPKIRCPEHWKPLALLPWGERGIPVSQRDYVLM